MPDRTPSSRITLPAGRYAVFADAAGTRIACADGTLWITQYADTRDIVLRAGDSFVVDRDGKVVVSAVSDSVFAAIPPAQAVQPAAWRRLALWWRTAPCAPGSLRLSAG